MYIKVKTEKVFYTTNGSDCTPFVTFADQHGGRVQFADDDGCYVLYVKHYNTNQYAPVRHWFPEAVHELKKLPDNARRLRRPYTFFSRILDTFNMIKRMLRTNNV